MSPLLYIIMRLSRLVIVVLAAILAAIIAVFLWQHHGVNGFALQQGDQGFLGLLVFLLVFSLYLARAIGREMSKLTQSG